MTSFPTRASPSLITFRFEAPVVQKMLASQTREIQNSQKRLCNRGSTNKFVRMQNALLRRCSAENRI